MYATGSVASDSIDHKSHSYRYDANGNLLYVGIGKKINDSTLLESSTRRLLWDEDNRLLANSDNGYVSNYWYDASGERTVKQSGGSEGVFVNGVLSAARTQTSKFTAYVSPYLVVSNGGNYSKHIYVGSQRITSKLSNSLIFDESRNPLTITKANNSVEPVNATDYSAKFNTLTGTIAERFDSLGVIYKGTLQSGGLITQGTTSGVTPQYFYHPDHLGSSSLITDQDGLLVQHIQYVPFGEVFVEERTTSWSTPYKFNAKELDPETGLYYYGARYYDPRTSVWLSVDPLAEKYPNVSSYVYCAENPVKYVDPDGRQMLLGGPALTIGMGKANAIMINNSDLQDAYTLGSALLSPFTGNVPTRFEITTNQYGIFNGVQIHPATYEDVEAAKSGLLLPAISGSAVNKAEKLLEKAVIGQEAHRQIQREIKIIDVDAKIEAKIQLKDRTVRKDAIKSDGTAVIIKPNTNSGQKSAKTRERLMRNNGFNTEVITYDPNNPAYRRDSPTYIGPKKVD